jgi:GH35 family endo-1,4-beta-xylanase
VQPLSIPVLAMLPDTDVSFGLSAAENPRSRLSKELYKVHQAVRARRQDRGNPTVLVVAAGDEDDTKRSCSSMPIFQIEQRLLPILDRHFLAVMRAAPILAVAALVVAALDHFAIDRYRHGEVATGTQVDFFRDGVADMIGAKTRQFQNVHTGHIERVVSRYRGKIKTWHVVNEPVDDARGTLGALRPSVWLQYLGPKYIDMSFRLAHRVDPAAELVLNEYDIECVGAPFATRRQALLSLVRDLLAPGVPLHGIGLQGHIQGKYEIDEDGLSAFVSEMKSLGLSVHVTELDVIDKELPGPIPVRDALVAARAHLPARRLCRRAAVGDRHLGITDNYTWVPMWNKRDDGLPNRPLPLDGHYQPKPLWAVIDYFCRKPA